jgi:filamentous hemagglutinin family protein
MKSIIGLTVAGLVLLNSVQNAMAQVVPDTTLPTTVTSQNNLNFTIDGGARSGGNLFHSFSQFSIPTTGSAIFNNPLDVQNIFARVTGGQISNIDGVLSANGRANLFLLNPSGLQFGPNAQLNLGGSFLGTTASSIQFADRMEFSAVNPTPLLTVSVPIGLQMGQNPGAIAVQGTGHRLTSRDSLGLTPLVQTTPSGIQLRPGNSLALVGNNISFNNGVVGAAQGRLEVSSVTGGFVSLNANTPQWQLGYTGATGLGDVTLVGRSLLDVSGVNAGSMQIQGRQIRLQDGSIVLSQNLGLQTGGELQIQASERLFISGTTNDSKIRSGINSETLGLGAGSKISVKAPIVEIQQGGNIFTKTFNRGIAGDIQITTPQLLQLQGFSPLNPTQTSTIGSGTLGLANSGNVDVMAGDVGILDGGVIGTTTFTKGSSGRVTVNADTIAIRRASPILAPSSLSTTSFGDGNSGTVTLNTRQLTITDGGSVGATAFVSGDAGSIVVNATESIKISGTAKNAVDLISSSINSSVTVPVVDFQRLLGVGNQPTGDAGTIEINTPSLELTDRASTTVRNAGTGQGGTLIVRADQIRLSQARISAETASGLGGDLDLQTNLLMMRQGSNLITTAGNSGNGGNVKINSPIILGLENSDIVANAFLGRGGNIQITTQGIIGLEFRNTLTPTTDLTNNITASSQFSINGTVQINNIGVDPNSGLVALPVDIVDPSQKIAAGCANQNNSSFIVTGRGGIPDNPSHILSSNDQAWQDLRTRQPATNRVALPGKDSSNAPLGIQPLLQATNWQRNLDGSIELLAANPSPMTQSAQVTCANVIKL